MRVGVSLRSSYDVADPRTAARWMVEQAAAASAAGLDSLFVGDHHATGDFYQNSPMLGRLLAEWGDRPAGALYLLPLWPPVLVAEQVGTLAALAAGRFILQCAVGGGEDQFLAMGADVRTRGRTFERHLDVVRRLLAGEGVDGTRIGPLPPERVEVWIAASAPPAVDRAARLGDGWLAAPGLSATEDAEQVAYYRDRCAAHGMIPSAVAIRRDVHVGADEADARRVADPIIAGGYRGFDRDALIVGGPDQVAERFRALEAMGYTDVIIRPLAADQTDTLACLERLGPVRDAVASN